MSVRFLAGIVLAVCLVGCSSPPPSQTTVYATSNGSIDLYFKHTVSFKQSKPGCYQRIESWSVQDMTAVLDQQWVQENGREPKNGPPDANIVGHGSTAAAALNDYLSHVDFDKVAKWPQQQ